MQENDDSEPPEAPFVHSRRPKVGSATDNLIDEPIKRVDASKMQSLNRVSFIFVFSCTNAMVNLLIFDSTSQSKSLSLMSTASQRRSLMLASGFESSEPNPSNASNKRSGDSKFDLTDVWKMSR
jgi:hypothetical protein